jgi:chromosome segregation ATPase
VIEQHDLVTKFELAELRKVHTDLTEALEKMRRDNRSQVEPVLQALRDEIATKNQELEQIDVTFARESTTNKNLLVRLKEVESIKENKVRELAELQTRLDRARMEPGRLSRQADATGKAVASMLDQLKELKNKIEAREADIAKIQQRKESQERLRQTIVDKNAVHRLTIEKREKDVGAVLRTLEDEKAKLHDNVTKKVELSIAKKEVDAEYRHKSEALNFMKKDYESAKRMYKKKRSYVDGIRQAIPVIESQLIDEEHNIKLYRTEITDMNRRNSILKDELDVNLAEFLSQEGIEKSKKEELMRSVEEVEAAELDVANWRAESKRQQKLINVLSTQRDIVSRECSRVTRKATDAKEQVHFKELSVLDATKRSNEVANRLKEFSALYEVVKNERNKYVNLIQSSSQALAEMKEKIRILNNEVSVLLYYNIAFLFHDQLCFVLVII